MKIHLVDGTYELFRNFYGAPPKKARDGREVGGTVGLLKTLLALVTTQGATHVACAFDHVVESFRNDLFSGYKTSEGIEPDLFAQFHPAERAVQALGLVVWPMVEFEADDVLAAGAAKFRKLRGVEQVVICSPDKDLAQCVSGNAVVCWDRRRDIVIDEHGVMQKFGVTPASIPDYLALVGDSADGYPGIEGWGAKSAAAVLKKFGKLEKIPPDSSRWGVKVTRASFIAQNLQTRMKEALLYRRLATLREDVPLTESLDDLRWKGATQEFKALCGELDEANLVERVPVWRP
ncbi:MAG: 5'-3' exonuclease H3TH domain-containing protein [Bacteroidota bacterium]